MLIAFLHRTSKADAWTLVSSMHEQVSETEIESDFLIQIEYEHDLTSSI